MPSMIREGVRALPHGLFDAVEATRESVLL